MPMVDLSGAYKVTSKGKTYWYAWRGKGAPRLTGEPGSQEFVASYLDAVSARKIGDKRKMASLCAMFRASDYWRGIGPRALSAKTRASWTTWLDRIQVEFGELSIAQFDRQEMRPRVTRWRNRYAKTPRAADMGIQVLSRLLSFAQAEGLLMHNICNGIEGIYSADRSGLIWTDAELTEMANHASPEVLQAVHLAALTGLRQSDLLRLSWSHVKPNSIEIATGKSGQRKTTLIPMYGELRDYLERIKKRATTVLVNTDGVPWRTGFGSSYGKAAKLAKVAPLHFHDLRGTAATRFYKAGLTVREIAEIMTWSEDYVEGLINRYVKKDELLRDRIRRMDQNTKDTTPAKRGEKPAS